MYEYATVQLKDIMRYGNRSGIQKVLDKYSAEGWRLHNIMTYLGAPEDDCSVQIITLTFERKQ